MYRLSLSINVPFEQLTEVEFDEKTLQPNPDVGFPLWKVKSAALHYGQNITSERVYLRDAVMSGNILSRPMKDKKEVEDHFRISNLEIAYTKTRPRSEYIKARRKELRKNRKK